MSAKMSETAYLLLALGDLNQVIKGHVTIIHDVGVMAVVAGFPNAFLMLELRKQPFLGANGHLRTRRENLIFIGLSLFWPSYSPNDPF